MIRYSIAYAVTAVVFLAVDYIWLISVRIAANS